MSDKELETPYSASQTPDREHEEEFFEAKESNDEESQDSPVRRDLAKGEEDGGDVQKTQSKASVNNVSSIPNGGLVAWLQVLGAFMLFFNTWGIVNTFGVYQTFYENGELIQANSSDLSWIGALQATLLLVVGSLTGPVYDAGHFRPLLYVGSVAVVFGQMMLSLCTEYYQVLLAQAVCIGLGAGLLFVPMVAIISTYFTTKLAFAIGVAASGSSFGGVIYPIVFHKLEPQIGFAWTTRTIGFIMLVTLAIPLFVMKVRVLPASTRKLVDWSAFKEAPYVLWISGAAIGFMGLYIPFFYIQYYTISNGITNENLGFYLLPILNTASIFGRVIPNFIADKTGPINMVVPCTLATSVLIFGVIGIHSVGSVIVFCILYGFFSGTFVSIPPAVFVTLSPNRGVIGTRMGMGFTIISIGTLTGTPIAGAILGKSNFLGIWVFGGAVTAASTLLLLGARVAKTGWAFKVKA